MITPKGHRIHGVLKSFNVSPKGSYESLLVGADGKTLQVNFPQHSATYVVQSANLDEVIAIRVQVQEPNPHAEHPVFQLLSLEGADGTMLDLRENGHFSATVKHLNYALHGEVNGAMLDTGDFLHVKPHGAKAIYLRPGMKVIGRGPTRPMMGGGKVIEAEEVNGLKIEHKPKPKKKHEH